MESLLNACSSTHILSTSNIAQQNKDLVEVILSEDVMSPTNQSAPSSPEVVAYSPSTFVNFPFTSTSNPLFILNPNTTSSTISEPLESTAFSCMSQTKVDQYTHVENYSNSVSENNNIHDAQCCKEKLFENNLSNINNNFSNNNGVEKLNSSSQTSSGNAIVNVQPLQNGTPSSGDSLDRNQEDISYDEEKQREEDNHYLGEGGYGMWRGEGGPGSWVRKMGYAERFMTGSADFGVMSTVYNLWFESKQEVQFDMIKRTCYLVARKLPHLRLAVGRRGGELWFKEMSELILDVEELETSDIMHSFETVLKKKFDLENGPLWFVRYIKIKCNDTSNTTVVNPDAKSRFVCLFGFHHNFTDGTTNMKFCNVFLNVLNDVILGRTTDMKVEAKLAEPLHDRMADKMRSDNLLSTNLWLMFYFCKRFYKGIISYGHFIRNYTDHYHQPTEQEAFTRLIPGELDEETTTKLVKRCREEKTSLNSAFTAAANLALYKMVLNCDASVESTHFGGIQTINMRRYWTKEQAQDSCGCHISTLDVRVPTSKKDFANFWSYARVVQDMMDNELNVTKRGIRMMPIGERLRLILYTNSFLEWIGYPSTNDNHYCVTNMGNLSKSFPGTGEVVEVTKLMRSVSCHYMPNLCQHTLHTFRGKLSYSLDYYTQKMEREHAKLYAKTVLETLAEVADAPKIISNL